MCHHWDLEMPSKALKDKAFKDGIAIVRLSLGKLPLFQREAVHVGDNFNFELTDDGSKLFPARSLQEILKDEFAGLENPMKFFFLYDEDASDCENEDKDDDGFSSDTDSSGSDDSTGSDDSEGDAMSGVEESSSLGRKGTYRTFEEMSAWTAEQQEKREYLPF
jgi:hypothetical protein